MPEGGGYVWWVELPSPEGFPNVYRIPVAVFVEPPPDDLAWLHGQFVEDWSVSPFPIGSYHRDFDYFHAIAESVHRSLRLGTLLPGTP